MSSGKTEDARSYDTDMVWYGIGCHREVASIRLNKIQAACIERVQRLVLALSRQEVSGNLTR